jgi:hypothetical protein
MRTHAGNTVWNKQKKKKSAHVRIDVLARARGRRFSIAQYSACYEKDKSDQNTDLGSINEIQQI